MGNRTIRLRSRYCENCEGNDLEFLWGQSFSARTRSSQYRFDVSNVICTSCGFVFLSPVFHEDDLATYYADSFGAFVGATPDYDASKRLVFLESVAPRGGSFVEVGANRLTDFHQRLKKLYDKVLTVEINNSVSSDFSSLAALPDDCVDVLAHYFVLEHIPDIRNFLKGCHRVLREGGVMVCEVPDILVYPDDPSALLLYEHTNHFSQDVLRRIAEQVGFAEISTSVDLCSRSFGFAIAFKKVTFTRERLHIISAYNENRERFMAGVKKLERLQADMKFANERLGEYRKRGASVIFWGANDLMARYFDQYSFSDGVTVVDSNPEKSLFFDSPRVLTPSAAVEEIQTAEAIFIFTKLYAGKILEQIEHSMGKKFELSCIHVVDPFGGAFEEALAK